MEGQGRATDALKVEESGEEGADEKGGMGILVEEIVCGEEIWHYLEGYFAAEGVVEDV